MLTDLSYSIEYDFDADRKVHFLARLRVGNSAGNNEDRAVEDLVVEKSDLFDRAASSTSQIRSEAIEEFTLAGEGLDEVLESLAFDPDPEVRTAAAQRLAEVKGFATIIGLVQAIDDPSSEVAQQAIRSLVVIGDRSVVPYMQHALE